MAKAFQNRQRVILVAPAAFKGSLSPFAAASAMAAGARRVCPRCTIVERPVADGGEQTARILAGAYGGSCFAVDTVDALGRQVEAEAAVLADREFAVDASSACGMVGLDRRDLDPLRASSFGLGLQFRAVLDRGASQVIVGVGGTAFVDGGVGIVQALGARCLDRRGRPLPAGGGALVALDSIDVTTIDSRVRQVRWILVLDVRNPLLGSKGAAAVYAPQKGANRSQVARLEAGLANLARVVASVSGRDLASQPGMGAGGGLAMAMVGLLDAQCRPGASFVCERIGLKSLAGRADLVLTGEGRLDEQSRWGKAPAEVARLARPTPVAAVVGSLGPRAPLELFDRCLAVSPGGPPAQDQAAKFLEQGAETMVDAYLGHVESFGNGGGATTTVMEACSG